MLWSSSPQMIPYIILAMLPALTFHEWGHAAMAKRFGDNTAEMEGRLTLNPMAHLDLFGALAILLIGFGWAKPEPENPANLRGKWAEFWVASAGPLMNIALASVFSLILFLNFDTFLSAEHAGILAQFLVLSIFMNFALAFFNMIPVGPLDGQKVLARLLPLRQSFLFENWNARYGSMFLMGIILVEMVMKGGPLRVLVWWPAQTLTSLMAQFAG
jgi:Zn-dependent protease